MRRTRPLLLLAILGILVAVGVSYYVQTSLEKRRQPPTPKSLPANTSAAASDWRWSKTTGSRPAVEVRAASFQQVKEPSRFDLEKVELRIYDKDGKTYDQVKSAHAEFDIVQGVLYADGEVEITTGVAAEGRQAGRLVFIRTSGVTFDSRTGKASTDRAATFSFERGEGKAVGAFYDPSTRELQMRSEAEVVWRGEDGRSRPMKVEAEELLYQELDSVIMLSPWSRLSREDLHLEAGPAFITLEKGAIRRVETTAARGKARHGGKQLEYAAENLSMYFSDAGAVEKIVGERNAHLASTSDAARTTVKTDRLDLDFEIVSGESRLRRAQAMGQSVVESKPLPAGSRQTPPSRVLRSEVIELKMQPDGEQIESVVALAPGSIEFLPNQPTQRRRRLEGDRMWIVYGSGNQIRSFRAVNVSTRTEPAATAGGQPGEALLTWSKQLMAAFDPESGELTRLEQSDDFRYEQGERKGRANRAVLEAPKDLITLEGSARLWDQTGLVSANKILLDQNSGDVTADGNVASTRQPERNKNTSVMLSEDEPLQAKASRMFSSDDKSLVRYDGNAVLWQGGNRIEADQIEIDRKQRRLTARGRVRTQFIEKPKNDQAAGGGKTGAPVFTMVEAPEMSYDDASRVAHYRGGVKLVRPKAEVKASELRAFLADRSSGMQLNRAYADGSVEILHSTPGRTRKGTAEHGEYYAGEERVVLYGGLPVLDDSLRGATRGNRLTWFANNDRLLVEGGEGQPSVSRIYRK
jgi:lipopolysaccharide export system protein LptA